MNLIKKLFTYEPSPQSESFVLSEEDDPEFDIRKEKRIRGSYVSDSIEKNLSYINERFNIPINNDVVIRKIKLKNGAEAFIIFYDGMVSSDYMDNNIIKSLLELTGTKSELNENLYKKFITHSQAQPQKDMDKIADEINFGSCALFVDGIDCAFLFDVRDWEHRSIDKPYNEQSIYGPQEAFGEMLRTNTALIRKIVKTEKLIAEGVQIGNVSKTRGVLLYIDDIANKKLVREAKRRINGIATDYIISIEQVQMFVEDKTVLITPQTLATERPDRAARALTEGRVVLVLNGSPRALVMPSNAFELTHSPSDEYMNVPFAIMSRFIRLCGMFLSLLLPALYLAITLYHQEIIPTYLLYSISASRENVPFPSLVEFLLMDVSFELIREAGLRMPSPIGSTLGIVGGLILGQAAVSAKIVSPIMIIIIAITGIGSFATADYTLGWTYRILRLGFVFIATGFGFYGIAVGIVLYSIYLGRIKSFGVPFLSPALKFRSKSVASAILINNIERREKRPHFLKTKRPDAEPEISMRWQIGNKED
ncbi:MAG: spore germination protein [Oscillospiraceae bacterium]|nr:spore germination protein [Oscillospiraceae bacterium]